MKPAPFIYHAPKSLEELLEILQQYEDTKLLSGGQTLGPLLNFRMVMPDHLIDLNEISTLAYIRENEGIFSIGAMTRQRSLERDSIIQKKCPIMIAALRFVGHFQTRNRGTIGGSLSNWDPSAELAGIMALYDAVLEVRSTRGVRLIKIADWGRAFMTTDLAEDEVLTGIKFRAWNFSSGFCFLEVARRFGDFAVAGVACLVDLNADRVINRIAVSLIGINHSPVRLYELEEQTRGISMTTELLAEFGDAARRRVTIEDLSGDIPYRQRVIATLVERSIKNAIEGAERTGG